MNGSTALKKAKNYVDEQIVGCTSSINMKVIDMGDKDTLINIDESFPTDEKNSYIVRGAFISTNILTLDREPVHIQKFGTQLFVRTLNGKYFCFVKNSSTNLWAQSSNSSSFVNNDEVLTLSNTIFYKPTKDYHPATKKYVDDNWKNIFEQDGSLSDTD